MRGLCRAVPLPLPGPSQGPELWGPGEQKRHGALRSWAGGAGWEGVLVGRGWGELSRARLPVSIPEAAPTLCSLPQAEAAGDLEVVTVLQSLQGGVGAQALGPVSAPKPRQG